MYYHSETSVIVRLTLLTETTQTCIILSLYFNITWISRGLEDHQLFVICSPKDCWPSYVFHLYTWLQEYVNCKRLPNISNA